MTEDWSKYEVSYDPLGRWEEFEATASSEQQAEAQPQAKEPSTWDKLLNVLTLGSTTLPPERLPSPLLSLKSTGEPYPGRLQFPPEVLETMGYTTAPLEQQLEPQGTWNKMMAALAQGENMAPGFVGTMLNPAEIAAMAATGGLTAPKGQILKQMIDWGLYGAPSITKGVVGGGKGLLQGLSAKAIEARIPAEKAIPSLLKGAEIPAATIAGGAKVSTNDPAVLDSLNNLLLTQREQLKAAGRLMPEEQLRLKLRQPIEEQLSAKFLPQYKAPWGGKFEPRNYDVTPDNIRKLSLQERAQQLNTKAAQETDEFIAKVEKQSQLGEAGKITKESPLYQSEYNRLVEENSKAIKKMEVTVTPEDLKQPVGEMLGSAEIDPVTGVPSFVSKGAVYSKGKFGPRDRFQASYNATLDRIALWGIDESNPLVKHELGHRAQKLLKISNKEGEWRSIADEIRIANPNIYGEYVGRYNVNPNNYAHELFAESFARKYRGEAIPKNVDEFFNRQIATKTGGVSDLNLKGVLSSEEGFLHLGDMAQQLKSRGIVGSEFPNAKDFRSIYKYLQLPHDIAKSHPSFKPIFDSEMAREATRNAQVRRYYEITKPYFELGSPADRSVVDRALLLGDKLRVNFDDVMLQKLKLTPPQIEAYKSITKGTGAVLDDLAAGMQRHGVEPAKINEFVTELRDKGFVPHKWYGKYGIVVQEPKVTQPTYGGALVTKNKTIYMTARESEKEANIEFDRLVKAYPNNIVKRIKRGEMKQLASFDVPPYAIQAMIDNAAKRAGTDPAVAQELSKALHDLRLAKGMGAHFIKRKWTPGYEENLERPLAEYFMGMSGYIAKMDAMKSFTDSLPYIKTPNLRNYAIKYIESIVDPEQHNVINAAKSLMFHYQLGMNLKFGVMNLTQNFMTGIPVLGKYTSFPEGKMIKAMSDVALSNLAPDEIQAIKFAKDTGLLDTRFIHEALVTKGDPFSHHGKLATITDISSYIPNLTEDYNRVSGFVAGYRALRDQGGRGAMRDQGSLPNLAKGAADISNEYNWLYGKGDRPELARGVLSPIMTFRLFGINYITMLKNFTKEGEWAALARSMGIMTTLAGAGGYVGAGAFEDWYNHFTGHDIRQDTRDWVSGKAQTVLPQEWGDRIGMMATDGLPAAVGPVTVSRSMGMGDLVPLDPTGLTTEALTKMLGVFAGQGEKVGTAYRAFEHRDYLRAAENLSPQFLQSIMSAYRLRTQGARNLAYQETLDPLTGKQIKLSTTEALLKGAGLQPVKAAEAQRRVGMTYDITEYMTSKGLKAAKLADGQINRGNLGRALQILNTTMKEDPRIAKVTAGHIRDWIGRDIHPVIQYQLDKMLGYHQPANMP